MKPKRETRPAERNKAEQALYRAFLCLSSIDEHRRFLKDLCSPAELQALVDRWQVVELLHDGLPYRRIHALTGVSVTTIGRVARFLNEGFGGYRTAIERAAVTNRD